MRLRTPVLASATMAAAAMAVPSIAGAAPIHNHALSIHATPNHIVAGESVLIYGRLGGRDSGNQEITLYHRINPAKHFTVIGHTRTNAAGQYEFPRAEGVVNSDRSWFVRGPVHSHSKTIHEHVAAEVSLNQSAMNGTTRHAITFSGTVTGGHVGGIVRLQQQNAAGNVWRTIKTGRLNGSDAYSLSYAWRSAGERNVRVAFGGDAETTSSVSDPVSVVIQQREAPYFSIGTSDAIVNPGTGTMISGTLYEPHTTTGEANTKVALYKHTVKGTPTLVGTTVTNSAGAYSFNVANTGTAFYQARTVGTSTSQVTANLLQAVRDTVTLTPSATTSTVGGSVSFTGTVSPADSGAVVYLEKLGRDGHWQVVGTSSVSTTSTFGFTWKFGYAGTKDFRAHVVGGPTAVGGWSAAQSITVSQPAISQLPSIG